MAENVVDPDGSAARAKGRLRVGLDAAGKAEHAAEDATLFRTEVVVTDGAPDPLVLDFDAAGSDVVAADETDSYRLLALLDRLVTPVSTVLTEERLELIPHLQFRKINVVELRSRSSSTGSRKRTHEVSAPIHL
jgi:hypothetical protein